MHGTSILKKLEGTLDYFYAKKAFYVLINILIQKFSMHKLLNV